MIYLIKRRPNKLFYPPNWNKQVYKLLLFSIKYPIDLLAKPEEIFIRMSRKSRNSELLIYIVSCFVLVNNYNTCQDHKLIAVICGRGLVNTIYIFWLTIWGCYILQWRRCQNGNCSTSRSLLIPFTNDLFIYISWISALGIIIKINSIFVVI